MAANPLLHLQIDNKSGSLNLVSLLARTRFHKQFFLSGYTGALVTNIQHTGQDRAVQQAKCIKLGTQCGTVASPAV